MSKTEEYSSVDLAIIQEILFERYSRVVRIEQGDAELHLDSKSQELTSCPAVYWEMENVGFVVFRLGKTSYRSQFFYDTSEQFNTGHGEFTNLAECVRMLLHFQAKHQAERNKIRSEIAAETLIDDSPTTH